MSSAGLTVSFLSGAVWGWAFWSWGLPLPIPTRILATGLLVAALAAASRAGTLAAAAFLLGMSASSGWLLASGGQLFVEWSGLVPAVALLTGVALVVRGLFRDGASSGAG